MNIFGLILRLLVFNHVFYFSTNGDDMTEVLKQTNPEHNKSEENKFAVTEIQRQVLRTIRRQKNGSHSRTEERKGEKFRNGDSEPEVALNVELVEVIDPLEALSVPGPSGHKHYSSYGNTAQNKAQATSESFQEISISNDATEDPCLLQSMLSLNYEIKEENTVEDTVRTEEETLADFNIVSQDDDSGGDDSSNDIIVSRFRPETESISDSSVYFKAQSTEKRKQKVTTELLFHRYKLKSEREIDRLHKKIRELKNSVVKYKRKVYKLQRRCDNNNDR